MNVNKPKCVPASETICIQLVVVTGDFGFTGDCVDGSNKPIVA